MTTLRESLTPEVLAYSEREGLLDDLRLAEELIATHFPGAGPLTVELVFDPDSNDSWISMRVEVTGTVTEIPARGDAFLHDWLAAIPWPREDKVRLLPWPI